MSDTPGFRSFLPFLCDQSSARHFYQLDEVARYGLILSASASCYTGGGFGARDLEDTVKVLYGSRTSMNQVASASSVSLLGRYALLCRLFYMDALHRHVINRSTMHAAAGSGTSQETGLLHSSTMRVLEL